NGPTPTAGSGTNSEFASANDTGPITIITEDPSCAPWIPIQNTLHDSEDNGWLQRDPSIPATVWSPEQREQYRAVAQAMRSAADQAEPLMKLTPHRVMRQLYEQFIAYSRTYADKVPTYTPPDDNLARTGSTALGLIGDICAAINYGSAAARAPLVQPGPTPGAVAPIGDPSNPKPFLMSKVPVCTDWKAAAGQFNNDTGAWREIPSDIPAGRWSPEQKSVVEAVIPVMLQWVDTVEGFGQRTDNSTLQDLASLSAQYFQAFARALPTYTAADGHLYDAARRASAVVVSACAAAGD
uniref:hypothetical protein n=1 Tax=Mycolicibacterium sp. TaxID=2320850 RepID=UPI0037C98778